MSPFGEQCGASKLKVKEILAIRELCRRNHSNKRIAEWFNISSGSLSSIKTGRYWKHIKDGILGAKQCGGNKLNEKQVLQIRELYTKKTHTQKQIAELVDVKRRAIHNIVHHKSWRFVK